MALDGGVVTEASLESWRVIGSGGFGQIFQARHLGWCCDVAVKLLHHDDGNSSALKREVKMMRRAGSPFVTQVLGVFQGRPPDSRSLQLGLVMEFMERGSLAGLQHALQGPPPCPLGFRLAHQVALGLNFLHSQTPTLLHLDLKPSNVLLDPSLNAKLTDFGLAKFYHSVSRVSRDGEAECGTQSYMPPEAFQTRYTPTPPSDIYSYGILLWSLVTGKQPYPGVMPSLVCFRIPRGDRPPLEDVPPQAAGLTGLMVKCWEAEPSRRPNSLECTTVTEGLFRTKRRGIHDAVLQVQKKLDEKAEAEEEEEEEEEETAAAVADQLHSLNITETSGSSPVNSANICEDVPTGPPPVQEVASGRAAKQPGGRGLPASASLQDLKASSVHPIPSHSGRTFPAMKKSQQDGPSLSRQSSSPAQVPPPQQITIHLSNVTGFQSGNYNTMNIVTGSPSERRRHPTAPP